MKNWIMISVLVLQAGMGQKVFAKEVKAPEASVYYMFPKDKQGMVNIFRCERQALENNCQNLGRRASAILDAEIKLERKKTIVRGVGALVVVPAVFFVTIGGTIALSPALAGGFFAQVGQMAAMVGVGELAGFSILGLISAKLKDWDPTYHYSLMDEARRMKTTSEKPGVALIWVDEYSDEFLQDVLDHTEQKQLAFEAAAERAQALRNP